MSGRNLNDPSARDDPTATERTELYDRATAQTVDDDILADTNLGLGNYSKEWLWMQVESYRKWVYTDAAIAGSLNRRVVDYALTQKAKSVFDELSHDERVARWHGTDGGDGALKNYWEPRWGRLENGEAKRYDRRRWIEAKKAAVWDVDPAAAEFVGQSEDQEELRHEKRLEIVEEWADGDLHWTPPFGRLLKARHEASRSLGARLIDNLFERVKKQTKVLEEGDNNQGLRERLGR